jgi:hypothetical protein
MKPILGESEINYLERLRYFAERTPGNLEIKLDAKVLLKLINSYLNSMARGTNAG